MNAFDIESTFHRFWIHIIGGVVVVLLFFLIIHSSKPKPALQISRMFPAESATVTQPNIAMLRAKRAGEPAHSGAGGVQKSLAERSFSASVADDGPAGGANGGQPAIPSTNTSVAHNDSPSSGGRTVRLIMVNNAAYQKVIPQDGAYFPTNPFLFQIHYFAAEPYLALSGLAANNGQQNYYVENGYFQGSLRLRSLNLEVRNKLLMASGQLVTPVLLSGTSDDSQPALLLWPTGCQAIFEAKSDSDGHISVKGGADLLEAFANTVGVDSQKAVRLLLSLPAAKCTNELPISGFEYDCDCLVGAKSHSKEQAALVQQEMEVANSFQKLFQAPGGTSSAQTFWQELDEKCQLVTQGRLGVTGYDFSGDAPARKTTIQLVMSDLSTVPNLERGRKELLESAVTIENLEVMASLTNRLAWNMNLAQIIGQLSSARHGLVTVANSKVAGEFRYAGSETPIARLSFAPLGPTKAQILAQIQQLDYQLGQLQASLANSPATAQTARTRIQQLQQEKAALAAKLNAFPATPESGNYGNTLRPR